MPERLNVYIPDDLHRALAAHRERLNVSRICQDALAREVARLESMRTDPEPLPELQGDMVAAIAQRLRAQREHRERFSYDLGYRLGFEWACDRADAESLRAIATGVARNAGLDMGWEHGLPHERPDGRAIVRAYKDLRQRARELAGATQGAPEEDLRAFNHGLEAATSAIWTAVADQVPLEPEPGQGDGPEDNPDIDVQVRVDPGPGPRFTFAGPPVPPAAPLPPADALPARDAVPAPRAGPVPPGFRHGPAPHPDARPPR